MSSQGDSDYMQDVEVSDIIYGPIAVPISPFARLLDTNATHPTTDNLIRLSLQAPLASVTQSTCEKIT
ncbi:hypothetical protein ABVK25_000890 [Lepraria finkii]|uniref:Uncharacterized protein n=1 Tax=Lepraria finkii TaxID=1340010 RepID=A0ABR4BQ66_9LECA